MSHAVTLLPGDGVGPEVTSAMRRVLDAACPRISWDVHAAGRAAQERVGHPLPEETVTSIRRNRVALKGPLASQPGSPVGPLNVSLRCQLGLFAQLRPVRSWPGLATDPADVVVARELTEDFAPGLEVPADGAAQGALARVAKAMARQLPTAPSAFALRPISAAATRRFFEFLFAWAEDNGRRRITVAHKATVLPVTDGLFLATAKEVAAEHPALEIDEHLVDALCAELVRAPGEFDVIAAPFLYGDILSDVAAAVTGGLGLAPGANYGDGLAVFEAAHGSVPKHAGADRVDPLATILSGVLLLRHLGETEAADRVEAAVGAVLAEGDGLTYDLVRLRPSTVIGTAALADRVISRLLGPMSAAPAPSEPTVSRRAHARVDLTTRALVELGRRGALGAPFAARIQRRRVWGRVGLRHGRRFVGDDRAPELRSRPGATYRWIWSEAAAAARATCEEFAPGFFRFERDGATTIVHQDRLMLDTPATTELAGDKAVLHRLLGEAGVPVPAFAEAPSDDPSPLLSFLEHSQGPWVVKPARGTGGGQGVTCGLSTADDVLQAWLLAAPWASSVLIEEQSVGEEYRLLLLDGELIGTVRRRPPALLGDGRRAVWQLMAALNAARLAGGPEEVGRLVHADLECHLTLARVGHRLTSRPEVGEHVVLKRSASENGRCDNETGQWFAPAAVADVRRAAEVASLRLAGVDVITPDPRRPLAEVGRILEVNGTPGLRHHYQVANDTEPVATTLLERLLTRE